MRYPRPRGRLGGYAEEVAAAMRRRREVRRPRVRVRVEHGEAQLMDAGSPQAMRLLVIARELMGTPALADEERPPHGERDREEDRDGS